MKNKDTQLLEEAYAQINKKSFPPGMKEKITRYAELSDPDAELDAAEQLQLSDLQKWAEQHGVLDYFEKHAESAYYGRGSSWQAGDPLAFRQKMMNPLRVTKSGKAYSQDIQGRKNLIRNTSVNEANSDWANEAEPKAPAKGGPLMLHVWEDVLADYTSGMAFAIASSKEEAALLAMNNDPRFKYDLNDEHVQELINAKEGYSVHSLSKPYGNYVFGGS